MIMAKIFIFLLLKLLFIERSVQINLGNACQNMWNAAGNNLITPAGPNQELTVNIPAANPLFQVVAGGAGGGGGAKIASLPFTTLLALLGDYHAHPPAPTPANINAFLNAVTQPGGPGAAAFAYLDTNGFLPAGVNNLVDFRNLLEDMWFTNSVGFQHVFVGERYVHHTTGQTRYKGFHNWFQFMVEQARNPTQTTNIQFNNPANAYSPNTGPPFMRGLRFTWGGSTKPAGSSLFVGTSPAFDLAMFSTCFIRGMAPPAPWVNNRRVTDCDCQITVAPGVVSTVEVRTVERQAAPQKVVTAYPTNVV